MSTHEHSRRVHELVDAIKDGYTPDRADVDFLRSFLPELPKQKTLEEIHEEVYEKWLNVEGDLWDSDNWGTMEEFLGGLQYQLKDLIDAPANTPALPAGMRIAEHNTYGRCVVSQKVDDDGDHLAFIACDQCETKCDHQWVDLDDLTFISAKPAHPEFLETEADYENAPVGTVAIREGGYPWTRIFGSWVAYSRNEYSPSEMAALRGKARVLRWGDK